MRRKGQADGRPEGCQKEGNGCRDRRTCHHRAPLESSCIVTDDRGGIFAQHRRSGHEIPLLTWFLCELTLNDVACSRFAQGMCNSIGRATLGLLELNGHQTGQWGVYHAVRLPLAPWCPDSRHHPVVADHRTRLGVGWRRRAACLRQTAANTLNSAGPPLSGPSLYCQIDRALAQSAARVIHDLRILPLLQDWLRCHERGSRQKTRRPDRRRENQSGSVSISRCAGSADQISVATCIGLAAAAFWRMVTRRLTRASRR